MATITKSDIANLSQNILTLIQTSTELETLKTVKEHLRSAVSLLQAKKHSTQNKENFKPVEVPALNSNRKLQIGFFSTKKQGKKWQRSVRKPSLDEQKRAKANLVSTEVKVCGICWNMDDDSSAADVLWIACERCGYWVHNSCVELEGDVNEYICSNCS